jgi:hypothetical protein
MYIRKAVLSDLPEIEKFFGKPDAAIEKDDKLSFTVSGMSENETAEAIKNCPLALVNKFRML